MTTTAEPLRRKRTMTLVLRILPDNDERLFRDENGALMLNSSTLLTLSEQAIRKAVRRAFVEAESIAGNAGKSLVPTVDFRAFNNDLLSLLPARSFGPEFVEQLLCVISAYRARWKAADGNEIWVDGPRYPEYEVRQHPALVRYGNVELRVLEDFLLAPAELRDATQRVVDKWSSEAEMYSPSQASGVLIHNDPDWNLRRLMTNAGFYIGSDADRAWKCIEEWADLYIAAIRNSALSWSNTKALFFQKIQRVLSEKAGFLPSYVQPPDARTIYQSMKGKEVLFLSPLAHLVNEQAETGRIWKLYQDYEVPAFDVRAIPAWISTWPHRPHSDWSETFSKMCESVRAAYMKRPFSMFIAACGCYGLPISDFARREFGCSTLYLGHRSHKLFGILPTSNNRINQEMWAKSDLEKYEYMDRIDKGRYLHKGR